VSGACYHEQTRDNHRDDGVETGNPEHGHGVDEWCLVSDHPKAVVNEPKASDSPTSELQVPGAIDRTVGVVAKVEPRSKLDDHERDDDTDGSETHTLIPNRSGRDH